MYGHMLLGLASFIENTYDGGSELWTKICKNAGVDPELGFFTHEVYNDDIFFQLAEAAENVLGVPMKDMLEQFGEYTFSVYWRKSRHVSLLDALGYTMDELIGNLDALHLHLSSTYTKMIAPSFSCEPLPCGLRVHYNSFRPGLAHYVKGVLHSVAENIYRLSVDIEIENTEEINGVMLKNHSQLNIKLKGDVDENNLKRLRGSLNKERSKNVNRPKTMASIPGNFHVAAVTRKRGGSITSPKESSVDVDTQWPITPELFCQISPFHILFDESLAILSVGDSMAQLMPEERIGDKTLCDYFSVEVPNVTLSYKNIRLHSAGLFVLNVKRAAISHLHFIRKSPRFRGQMTPLSNTPASPILFLASPAVNSFQELESMGLTSAHLAPSDPLHELLKNNAYFAAKVNLSDELERAKHHLQIEQTKLCKEKDRIDHLLQAMLPIHVAVELKSNGYATPQEFSQISILFTGLENFEAICKFRNPLEVVVLLNKLFKCFDGLVEKHHVYKVETTGDSYMMAAGLPGTASEHAQSVTNMAFDMREIIERKAITSETDIEANLELVIGIHSGPVVAGVIGTKLPRYCLFGDTVNTASRMNSTGEVGKIHISHVTYENLKVDTQYYFVSRGNIFVKGLGLRTTYFVESNKVTPAQIEQIKNHEQRLSQTHQQPGSCVAMENHETKVTESASPHINVESEVCGRIPITTCSS